MKTKTFVAAIVAATSLWDASAAQTCAMSIVPGAGVPGTPVRASTAGAPALYFRAHMNVNTDGASRSYHPQDPRGKTLALNNIANAITGIRDAQGKRIDCKPRKGPCFTRYITTFEAARDAKWDPSGHPSVATDGIIPWALDPELGRKAPCTIQTGPFAGYFVSETSQAIDESRGACDQARYVDSLTVSAIVLPKGAKWRSQGVVTKEFDLVAVRDRASGRLRYAIVGDRGPPDALGEGSIALTAALNGRTLTGSETYDQIKTLALKDVDYVLFPTFDAKTHEPGPVTQQKIDKLGAEAFEAWGGTARLDVCRAELGD